MWFPSSRVLNPGGQHQGPAGPVSPLAVISRPAVFQQPRNTSCCVSLHLTVIISRTKWPTLGFHRHHDGAEECWGPGYQEVWMQILLLPCTRCMTLSKLLHFHCLGSFMCKAGMATVSTTVVEKPVKTKLVHNVQNTWHGGQQIARVQSFILFTKHSQST